MTIDDSGQVRQLAEKLAQVTDAQDIEPGFIEANRTALTTARDVIDSLLNRTDPPQPPSDVPADLSEVTNGGYEGGNHMLALDLRVDFSGSGVVSGDLFGTTMGGRDYLASFRTAPGERFDAGKPQPWIGVFEGRDGNTLTGSIELRKGAAPGAVTVALEISGALEGLPANRVFEMSAEWRSPALRRLGIELEQETGTEDPPTFDFNGRSMTYRVAFADAGFDVFDTGVASAIPREAQGWGNAQLHALMTDFAQSDLSREAWRQQLLWLGKPTREGLLGIMFDSTAQLPRQGTAVFDGEIRDRVPNQTERKIIQTAVHEIGHGLNLAHRFEREVGRADSTSFMNYDWRYKGGGRRAEFWNNFQFTFDPDELEFLRHAPRSRVIPGGAPFHSVNYWADGNGGYSPYAPEAPLDIIDMRLDPPIGGPVFAFGQPVFLQVTMTNTGQRPLDLDRRLLDPKGDFLQVVVRRVQGGPGGGSDAMHFHPIVERCMDLDPGAFDIVQPGDALSDNLNITFGSGGFTFAEPGTYEVQVFLSVFTDTNELIAPSNKLTIRIAHPQSIEEEAEVAMVLLRDDVGAFFALGGSSALDRAEDDLKEVLERRTGGKKAVSDPVAASILRCLGIDAGRRYRRLSSGRFRISNGDPEKAAKLLGQLGKSAMKAFDASTAAATERLMEKHKDVAAAKKK